MRFLTSSQSPQSCHIWVGRRIGVEEAHGPRGACAANSASVAGKSSAKRKAGIMAEDARTCALPPLALRLRIVAACLGSRAASRASICSHQSQPWPWKISMYLRCNSPGPCARARAHISIGTRGSSRVCHGTCLASVARPPRNGQRSYSQPISTLFPPPYSLGNSPSSHSALSYTHIPECLECATHTAPPLLRVTRRQGKTRAGTCRCVCAAQFIV